MRIEFEDKTTTATKSTLVVGSSTKGELYAFGITQRFESENREIQMNHLYAFLDREQVKELYKQLRDHLIKTQSN